MQLQTGGGIEETGVNLSFRQWLASVTERINQTMHFQFDGKPEPLGRSLSIKHLFSSFLAYLERNFALFETVSLMRR